MTNPLVSAIITTRQRPDLLLRAVQSISSETWPATELIVVEDGCELPPDFLHASGPHTRLIQHPGQELIGVAGARNLGLAHAAGEYLICLDDDDVVEQDRIATLVELARQGGYAICYGSTRKHLPGAPDNWYPIPTYPHSAGEVTFTDLLICFPHINSILWRVDSLKNVGGFDNHTPNFDEWSPLLKILDRGGRACYTEKIVADWFVHDRGLTGEVQRQHSMKQDIETLLEVIHREVGPTNSALVGRVQEAVSAATIQTYDDYANFVVKYLRHEGE
jgi:glycosyltransferase involved in cell wall biosynthesis